MIGLQLDSNGIVANAVEVENEYWLEHMGLFSKIQGVWIGDMYPRQYTDNEITQQKMTEFELGIIEQGQRTTGLELSVIAQGQAVTDLELLILGGI